MANGKIIYTPLTFKSLTLNGSEYCDLASGDFNVGTGNFSIDALIYPQISAAAGMYIANKVNATPIGYGFYVDPTNMKLVFDANDGVNAMSAASANNSLVVDTWHWVKVEVNRAGSITLFINGVSAGSSNISTHSAGNWDNAANFIVGDDFTGKIGYLRLDKNRLLPSVWNTAEYYRLYYGYPRFAQDFQAVWTFNESLIDLSDTAYTLTHSGTAAYAAGWPTNSISYEFDLNYEYGHKMEWIEADDLQRSIDGTLIMYNGPRKRSFSMDFLCHLEQMIAFQSIYAAAAPFYFYEDADGPRSFEAVMTAPPEVRSKNWNLYEVGLDLVET